MQPLIYFLHIPKTAGTSFTYFLEQLVDKSRIYPLKAWDSEQDFKTRAEGTDWEQYSLISGHYTNALVDFLPPDAQIVTILRDPVERLISHFHHLLNDPYELHYYDGKILKNFANGNVLEMLKDERFRKGLSNFPNKILKC